MYRDREAERLSEKQEENLALSGLPKYGIIDRVYEGG